MPRNLTQLRNSVLWVRLFLPHPFWIVTAASRLFSDHLSLSKFLRLFSTTLKVVPSPPPSAQLFSPLPCSSQLPNDSHLCRPRLQASQLFSTRFNSSSTLPTSSHLRLCSTHLTSFLSPSQFFSPLASSSQLFSPPVTKMLTQRASCYTEKHLHTTSSYARQILTRSKLLRKVSFCTEKLFHKASKACPSIILYYKACTTHVPVLLGTT